MSNIHVTKTKTSQKSNVRHSRPTWCSTSFIFTIPFMKSTKLQQSFLYQSVKTWNSIPHSIKIFSFCKFRSDSKQQWCRSLLSIGGDNLQFYPNFALFSTLGGWTSTTILFRCGNSVKTKKKANGTHFFPQIQVKRKKRSSTRIEHFFSLNLRSDVHPSKLVGGMQMWTILKLLGGDTAKLLGDISPHPSLVSAPLLSSLFLTISN